jgi:ABC-type branched-subunit amino acid transport system substrate-binding protein
MSRTAQARRHLFALGAAAVVVLSAATACSSGSSASSPATSPAAASPVGATSTGATPAKSPFTFFFEQTPLTGDDNLAGIKVAVAAINAAGGVDGHPLAYQSCSDNTDPNDAVTCARQGISSSSVLAFVDNISVYGATYVPLLQQAGIANFGNLPSSTADDTSKISFPLNGGTFNTIVSAVAATEPDFLGAKKIGVPYIGVPAGAQLAPFIGELVKPAGGAVVGAEAIPPTATDYTSYAAAEISAKPDVVVDGQTAAMYTQFIKAVRQQGDTGMKFLVSTGVFDAGQVKSLFGTDPNIYLDNEYDHAAPGYQHFLSDVAKYDPSYPNRNDSVLSGWIGVYGFAQILKGIISEGTASPTRADIVNYLNKQTDFDVEGLTGGINFTKPNPSLGGAIPRIFNDRIWLAHAVNGTAVPLNGNKPFSLYLK